jgi:hypothetical protein
LVHSESSEARMLVLVCQTLPLLPPTLASCSLDQVSPRILFPKWDFFNDRHCVSDLVGTGRLSQSLPHEGEEPIYLDVSLQTLWVPSNDTL